MSQNSDSSPPQSSPAKSRRAFPMAAAAILLPALMAWVYLGTRLPDYARTEWYAYQLQYAPNESSANIRGVLRKHAALAATRLRQEMVTTLIEP